MSSIIPPSAILLSTSGLLLTLCPTLSAQILPNLGNPYNQLAVISQSKEEVRKDKSFAEGRQFYYSHNILPTQHLAPSLAAPLTYPCSTSPAHSTIV